MQSRAKKIKKEFNENIERLNGELSIIIFMFMV